MRGARGIGGCTAIAACACAALAPVAAASKILTLKTAAGPVDTGQQVQVTSFLRWDGPRGSYLCAGTLTGELSTNERPVDAFTLTQGSLPGSDADAGCLTSYVGEVQVTPASFPWVVTVERRGRGRLHGERGIVVDWRLIDYQQQCVFARTAAVDVTYGMFEPIEIVWPPSILRENKSASGSLCEREGRYSGQLYLSSRGEPVEAFEEAVQ